MRPAAWKSGAYCVVTSPSTVSYTLHGVLLKSQKIKLNFILKKPHIESEIPQVSKVEVVQAVFRDQLFKSTQSNIDSTEWSANVSTIFLPSCRCDWHRSLRLREKKKLFLNQGFVHFTRQFSTCLNSNSSNVILWIEFHELTTRRLWCTPSSCEETPRGFQRPPSVFPVWTPPFRSSYKNFTAGNYTVTNMYTPSLLGTSLYNLLFHAESCQALSRSDVCFARLACHS